MKPRFGVLLSLTAAIALGLFWSATSSTQALASAEEKGAPAAVESDMHEFMEYVYQPTFKRLKAAMASEPANNQAWKTIKADSLILAESGNLLLFRKPTEDVSDWVQHSVQTRDFGGKLYRAAKAKDYKTAQENYVAMIKNCNACHHQFAGGEHILEP